MREATFTLADIAKFHGRSVADVKAKLTEQNIKPVRTEKGVAHYSLDALRCIDRTTIRAIPQNDATMIRS